MNGQGGGRGVDEGWGGGSVRVFNAHLLVIRCDRKHVMCMCVVCVFMKNVYILFSDVFRESAATLTIPPPLAKGITGKRGGQRSLSHESTCMTPLLVTPFPCEKMSSIDARGVHAAVEPSRPRASRDRVQQVVSGLALLFEKTWYSLPLHNHRQCQRLQSNR